MPKRLRKIQAKNSADCGKQWRVGKEEYGREKIKIVDAKDVYPEAADKIRKIVADIGGRAVDNDSQNTEGEKKK